MDRLFFADIFYPGDKDSLEEMVKSDERQDVNTPGLFLLPHAHLGSIQEMYRDAFSMIHHPKKIVIIAPLHAEVLESDKGSTLFTYPEGMIFTPLGAVEIEPAPGARVSEVYAEEEYSIELFYPYVAANCPEAVIMPVLAALETKEDVLALARLIQTLKKDENNTVFIISGNFTAEGKSDEILRQARTLEQLLENNAPLLDAIAKKQITGCACRILEAARTTTQGSFKVKKTHSGTYTGTDFPDDADGRIWQVYAIKE